MANFTHDTAGYEHFPAYIAFKNLFDSYLVERDYEKTLSFMEDDFYSLGTGGNEVASNKAEFIELLRAELDVISQPIDYKVNSIYGKEIAENIWNILAVMEVILPNGEDEKILYATHFTGCFRLSEEGFVVTSVHMSEPSGITQEEEEEARLKEILIYEASYDALTGVYNRGYAVRTIEHELKSINAYSFAFFDIDNLKLLNDVYSHAAGDRALKYFAKLLMKQFDEETILARFGGDEFIAFFRNELDKQQIELIFSKLEQEYCSFIERNYPESYSSVSVGCVIGAKKCTFEELCQTADELMYDIKKNGKKGYKILVLD